jgi:GR25 family glycosyltransferase involved in LPS biosynthesis
MKSFIITLENHDHGNMLSDEAVASGKQFGWNIEKFKAVDGRNFKLQELLDRYDLKLYPVHKKQCRSMERPGVFGNLFSHYTLWQMCVQLNEPIGCFEHDVLFLDSPQLMNMEFTDLLKLDQLKQQKNYSTGICWQGAHAYILKPSGAKKLLQWSKINGVMGADIMIGTGIVDIEFDKNKLIHINPKQQELNNSKKYSPFSTSKTMTF